MCTVIQFLQRLYFMTVGIMSAVCDIRTEGSGDTDGQLTFMANMAVKYFSNLIWKREQIIECNH